MKSQKINYIVKISILSALAFVLMLVEFALPIFPSFLKVDVSDIPALLGGFALGPIAGFLIELIKNMLHFPMTTTLGIGEFANFIVGTSFVVTSASLYRASKTRKNAFVSLIAGALVMTVMAVVANYYIFLPLYARFLFPVTAMVGAAAQVNKSIKDIYTLVVYGIMPFNIFKGVLVGTLTFLMYKKVSPILHK